MPSLLLSILLLAPPKYGDPTVMRAYASSNALDVATAFVEADGVTDYTAVCWLRWRPRAALTNALDTVQYPFVQFVASAEAARSTREGGAALPAIYEGRPSMDQNGSTAWSNPLLPERSAPVEAGGSQYFGYGCYCYNVVTPCDLVMNIGGAEVTLEGAPGVKQVGNVVRPTSSRYVSFAAAEFDPDIEFAIAEQPLVQFVGAQCTALTGESALGADASLGGLHHAEWRMFVCRASVETNCLSVAVAGYNAQGRLANGGESVQQLATPRAAFARDARLRVVVASTHGMGVGTGDPDAVAVYGWRVYRGRLPDALVERMRDQDAAELQRRGAW